MNLIEQPVVFAGNSLILNNQRSIFWYAESALIFSDLHSGKSAHFRKHGLAIPSYMHQNDLDRLRDLIQHYQPKKVIVVGDLLHAASNKEDEDLHKITSLFKNVQFILVKGNHDRVPEKLLQALGINTITEKLLINNIQFIHQPITNSEDPTISGHIHPGVQIQLLKNSKKKLPCFVVQSKQIILPAFSKFTGLDVSINVKDATCYGFHENGFFVV